MEKTSVQKLASALRLLVLITFACNIIALFLVPGLATLKLFEMDLNDLFLMGSDPHEPVSPLIFLIAIWPEMFRHLFQGWRNPYVMLTMFLLFCGVCTAVILWQGKRALDTVLNGNPFTLANAANLKRAAVCCFLISGAALVRVVWGLIFYRSIAPLLTYNALFIPVFFMAGLLCQVMSALFRQAAELKEDQDLTI